MKPSTALDRNRTAIRETVGRFRATNPRIFGSVLYGIDRDDSDLDLLVDVVAGGPGDGPIHQRLAHAWGCDAAGAEQIRAALVLLADHELNASTFAARDNAAGNDVSGRLATQSPAAPLPAADCVVANILAGTLLE